MEPKEVKSQTLKTTNALFSVYEWPAGTTTLQITSTKDSNSDHSASIWVSYADIDAIAAFLVKFKEGL